MRNIHVIVGLLAAACSGSALGARLDWGVDLTDQDRSVRPGDDFAMYENGAWYKRTELGAQQPNSAYWRDVRIAAGKRVNDMLADLSGRSPAQVAGAEAMVAAFHRSATDEATMDRAGLAPLQSELNAILAARDKREFARLMGSIEGPGTLRQPTVRAEPGRDFFSLSIDVDRRDPSRYALYVGQAGLILPGPEYYVQPEFADIRSAYQHHVADVLR
jgi:predicted metalloendopeptidase